MSRARSRVDKSEVLKRRQGAIEGMLAPNAALDVDDCAYHVNLDELEAGGEALFRAFPYSSLHALRVEAALSTAVFEQALGGRFGARVERPAELSLALARCAPERVVAGGGFRDAASLERCLEAGVQIVIDSLQELRWLEGLLGPGGQPPGAVLLGVNVAWALPTPPGAPTFTGIDVQADRLALLSAFKRRSWLRGLALSASPSWSVPSTAAAVGALVELAAQIEQQGGRVAVLDLGDCQSTTPEEDEDPPVQALIDQLATAAPELMLGVLKGRWRLQTGVGAGLFDRPTSLISRVASTRRLGNQNHAWCGAPGGVTAQEVRVHTPTGGLKRGAYSWWSLHGPGPAAPDLLARAYLPPIAPGDLVWTNGLPCPAPCPAAVRPAVYGGRSAEPTLALLEARGSSRPSRQAAASSTMPSSRPSSTETT